MRVRIPFVAVMVACQIGAGAAPAADSSTQTKYEQAVAAAVRYLTTKGRSNDGSYSTSAGPGVTALITTSLLKHGIPPRDPKVAGSLAHLETFVRPDGGIYAEGSLYQNYETCLAIVCFQEANRDGRYDKLLKRADAFIKDQQWDEGEGKSRSDEAYGGAGYGRSKRPDLSNTAFLLDALKEVGNSADSEAIQRALIFVSRCQNLETEHNLTPFAAKNPDGGFYYTPAGGGVSMAEKTPEGGLRSYGSMTYAGLKSMIYAGVGPDDPRVRAAVKWIKGHYDVRSNPNMGDAGLYYYYHTFAKALDAMGADTLEDERGVVHNWRDDLISELAARQRPDGSWVNTNDRWLEGDPNLATGYALLALAHCRPRDVSRKDGRTLKP
jgi:squalene-hopene/tetraprenyl-beta-curcumene cyclase